MKTSFYSEDELTDLGFKSIGKNVCISRNAQIYSAEKISIGNNVRIDDFCILSGEITIGNYVHISAYNALYGKYGIQIGNFCGISPRCSLFSAVDDFSGQYMISPLVPPHLTNLNCGCIILDDYVQIGSNSIIFPSVHCKEGSACGAFSFIKKSLDEWTIYKGIPVDRYKSRSKKIKKMAETING